MGSLNIIGVWNWAIMSSEVAAPSLSEPLGGQKHCLRSRRLDGKTYTYYHHTSSLYGGGAGKKEGVG